MCTYVFWAKTLPNGFPNSNVDQHASYARHMAKCLYSLFSTCKTYLCDEQFLLFLTAVHDSGKISCQFQCKCPQWLTQYNLTKEAQNAAWAEPGFSHAKASQIAVELFLQTLEGDFSVAGACWGAVVGAHHGRMVRPLTDSLFGPPPIPKPHSSISWNEERQAFIRRQWLECGSPSVPEVEPQSPRLWTTAGLITLADWLASDETLFPPDTDQSVEVSAAPLEAVAALGLAPLNVTPGLHFEDIFSCSPYEMQQAAWESITGPGVHIIEAPMGMGKTEAALMAAYKLMEAGKARGLYFGLPTQTTSNRIFLRVQDFAQRISTTVRPVQLIHSNAWLQISSPQTLQDAQSITDAHTSKMEPQRWFSSSRRALLAPIGVGTADQAMMSALAVKHFPLRRLALMGKVVILDEVHSYDFYSRAVIRRLCNVLVEIGCTVIILSATLTAEARSALLHPDKTTPSMVNAEAPLLPYPLISTRIQDGTEQQRAPASSVPDRSISVQFTQSAEAAAHALHLAEAGGQVLWVCNTVGSAQEAYTRFQAMRSSDSPIDIGVLHSRLPFFMREAREDFWMERFGKRGERRKGAILVSTQLVEQSVDLDADLLITELAPTDMLLQRLGRLWRHPRPDRPVSAPALHIVAESLSLDEFRTLPKASIVKALGSKAFVYDPYILLRTLELWSDMESLSLPGQIRKLIHDTYAEPDTVPQAWMQLYDVNFSQKSAHRMLASLNTDIWRMSMQDAEEYAPTRLIPIQEYTFVICTARNGSMLTLLDGSTVQLDSHVDVETRKQLYRNHIKIPEYRLTDAISVPNILKKYDIHGLGLLRGETLHLTNLRAGVTAQWNDELGIQWLQQRTEK